MSRQVLEAKSVGETLRYDLDFLSQLASGETITSVTTTMTVFAGTDDAPEDMLVDVPWYSGTIVFQRVTGGVAGVIYLLTATITTSVSQVLIIYGYLAVLVPSGSDVSLECCPRIGNATSGDGQAFSMTFAERPVTAYSDGLQIFAIFDNDVTVAVPTVNIDLLGAKTIKRSESLGVAAYDILTDDLIHLVFDQDADAFIALGVIPSQTLCFAAADQSVTITVGTKFTLRGFPAGTLLDVWASLETASTSGAVTIDVNEGGVSILGTKITIDQDETSSITAATPKTITDRAIAANSAVSVDIDGAGTGAKGWALFMKMRWLTS